jgi:hypothetical protein
MGFRQGGHIAVIPQMRPERQVLLAPLDQRKVVPAIDLVTCDDVSCCSMHRTSEADTQALNRMMLAKFCNALLDLR